MAYEEVQGLIDTLNGITVGELSRVRSRLQHVRRRLLDLEQADLSVMVHDAERKLNRGDVGDFRRLIANVVSRLGHLK